MVIEGLLTMQLNVSSMDMKDRLYAFLPPSERATSVVETTVPLMDADRRHEPVPIPRCSERTRGERSVRVGMRWWSTTIRVRSDGC